MLIAEIETIAVEPDVAVIAAEEVVNLSVTVIEIAIVLSKKEMDNLSSESNTTMKVLESL
jgi:hypothetical protein